MGNPVIGVLALQGDVREHLRAFQSLGAQTATVRTPEALDRVDALVIPGGESTTMWRLARAYELLDPLRKRIAEQMPAFGSCAGMIMLADHVIDAAAGQETIGGLDITVRRNAFGRQVDSFEADLTVSFSPSDRPMRAIFIRAPWVEKAGKTVEVVARIAPTGDESGQDGRVVAVRQGPLLATAFHPELTSDVRMHEFFLEIVKGA